MLYTTPQVFIKSLEIESSVDNETGLVHFKIGSNVNQTEHLRASVMIYDKEQNLIATQMADDKLEGIVNIDNVRLWWPFLMDPEPAYLYTMEIHLSTRNVEDIDIYRTKFGIRTLKWNNTAFLINDKPIYFRGFGRHEDSDVCYLKIYY